MGPIFLLTGAPGVGKTTVAKALLGRFELGVHIEVDELRECVVSGIAGPLEWTDRTTEQFELAEDTASDMARRYSAAGYAVVIDHCTMAFRLEAWLDRSLARLSPRKVVLVCSLDVNRDRNRTRTVKSFDTAFLDPVIQELNRAFRVAQWQGWHVLDNTHDSVEQTVDRVLDFDCK